MNKKNELSAVLPDGMGFDFWEKECKYERTLYVAGEDPKASDSNDGSIDAPFKTINRAAKEAKPGTKVIIRGGIYRECLTPRFGGSDPEHMISYEAYPGEQFIIRASEQVTEFTNSTGWRVAGFPLPSTDKPVAGEKRERRIWKHELDPEMFKGYNPFCAVNILHDRLFIEYDKTDMTTYLNRRGCIFCDGEP